MTATRRILSASNMPRRVQASRSRMDETPAEEGDIPAYFLWEDGSEYEVLGQGKGRFLRRYHGTLFGRALGDWKSESFLA